MQRYIVSSLSKIELSKNDIHHITNVMRLSVGDKIILNCNGLEELYEIVELNPLRLSFVKKISKKETTKEITLFISLLRNNNFDLVVEKAVELGVSKIVPFISSRTVVKSDTDQFNKKIERYNRIIKEAVEQSERGSIPVISPLIPFSKINEYKAEKNYILFERGDSKLKIEVAHSYNLVIGPEGGFSSSELNELTNYQALTISPNILRSETAALSILSIIGYINYD